MQNFKELYKELADKITANIPEVKWIDLWNSQVYDLENEHPFPAPAVFLAFRSNQIADAGKKVQQVTMQIDVFVFYETFLDTYKDAWNQNDALRFLDLLDAIHALFHGSSGTHYSSMRRVSFSPVDTGGAGNLWSITFNSVLMDYGAEKQWDEDGFKDVEPQPFDTHLFLRR